MMSENILEIIQLQHLKLSNAFDELVTLLILVANRSSMVQLTQANH